MIKKYVELIWIFLLPEINEEISQVTYVWEYQINKIDDRKYLYNNLIFIEQLYEIFNNN